MKIFTILAAAFLAVVSAETPNCDLGALAPVAGSADATQCGKDADGYSVISATYPTDTQLPKMCLSTACNNLLAALKKAAPTECLVTLVDPPVALYAKLLTPIETSCEKIKKDAAATPKPSSEATTAPPTTKPATTTTAPSTTTTAPTATTTAPTTTSKAPATTTEAPAKETSSTSGSTATSSAGEEIESPTTPAATKAAANSTTSTPAPTKSSAMAMATAAGAVVFAVAASMF